MAGEQLRTEVAAAAQEADRADPSPIVAEIIRHGLLSIANQVDVNITRTAFSPLIYEYKDYAVGIVDAEGRLICQSSGGIPLFVANAFGIATRDGLAVHGRDGIRAGDVLITNDPWLCAGHLFDIAVVTPVFVKERVVALIGTVGHVSDIGGTGVAYGRVIELRHNGAANGSGPQRVVVTGIGAVTPLALSVPATWEELLAGHSGIDYISTFDTSDLRDKYTHMFDRESAYELLSAKFTSQGVMGTARVLAEEILGTVAPAAQTAPQPQRSTIQVFNPSTGQYEEREMQAAPSYPAPAPVPAPEPAPVPAQARKVEQAPPPVLVYNPATGQYEPQDLKEYRAPAPVRKQAEPRKEKTVAQKMLDNFTRSTASGAGYQVGRSITRNILGVFGIK